MGLKSKYIFIYFIYTFVTDITLHLNHRINYGESRVIICHEENGKTSFI